ncbi:KCA10-like protein [Mya arenaria]|uniref:KCA10-like protein n=1 Tax=Mya arenaria TaxID=6604 RepID=A0ABY7F4V0_MYAAR|nr:KCA10-like protein [Mya arenaria]
MDDKLHIVVGGQAFSIGKTLIDKGPSSKLQKLLNCEPISVERPPEVFTAILGLYQTGELHVPLTSCPRSFLCELEFWEIDLDDQVIHQKFLSSHAQEEKGRNVCFGHCSGLKKLRSSVWNVLDYKEKSWLSLLYFAISVLVVLTSIFVIAYSTDESFHRAMTNCEQEFLKHCDSLVVPFQRLASLRFKIQPDGSSFDNQEEDIETLDFVVPVEEEVSKTTSSPLPDCLQREATTFSIVEEPTLNSLEDFLSDIIELSETSTKQTKPTKPTNDDTTKVINFEIITEANGITTDETNVESSTDTNDHSETNTNNDSTIEHTLGRRLTRSVQEGYHSSKMKAEPTSMLLKKRQNKGFKHVQNVESVSSHLTKSSQKDTSNHDFLKRFISYSRQERSASDATPGVLVEPAILVTSSPCIRAFNQKVRSLPVTRSVSIPNMKVKITVFATLESICLVFFTVDILLRLLSCPSIVQYFKSIINITDAIALIAAYVYMLCLFQVKVQRYQNSWIDFLWYIQLLRAFRLFRIMGHIRAGKVLLFVVLHNMRDFLIVAIFLVAGMCTFASVIYLAEGKDVVKDIPTGWYWAVVTMTTVGYGDISPKTAVGRALSCVCALCGVLMLAMTIPIVAENFIKLYGQASAKPASQMEDFCIVVGGQTFEIAKTLVDKGPPSKLQKLAKCEPIRRIERPPEVFSAILSLYQTGELHMPMTSCPAAFLRELEFWEIGTESIPLCCSQRIEHFLKDQALQQSFLSAQSDDSVSCHVRHCSGLRKMVAGVWKVLDYKDSSFLSLSYFTINVFIVSLAILVQLYFTINLFIVSMPILVQLYFTINVFIVSMPILVQLYFTINLFIVSLSIVVQLYFTSNVFIVSMPILVQLYFTINMFIVSLPILVQLYFTINLFIVSLSIVVQLYFTSNVFIVSMPILVQLYFTINMFIVSLAILVQLYFTINMFIVSLSIVVQLYFTSNVFIVSLPILVQLYFTINMFIVSLPILVQLYFTINMFIVSFPILVQLYFTINVFIVSLPILVQLYFTINVFIVSLSIVVQLTDESFHRAMTNCERLDYMIRNNMENVENVEKDLLKHCDSLVVPFALFTSNTRNGNFEDNMDTDQTTLNYIIPIEDEIYPPSTPFSTFLEGETIKPFSFDQMAKAIDDLFAKEVDSLEASEKQSKSNNDSTDENMVLNGSAREGTNGGITIESITEFDTGSNVFGDSDTNRLRGLPNDEPEQLESFNLRGLPNDDPEQLERFGLRGLPNDDPEELKNFDLRGLSNDDLEQLEENFKGSSTARTQDGKTDADNMGVFKRSTPSVRQIRDAHPDRIIVSAPTTHTLHNSDSGSGFKIVSIPNLNVKITVFVCLELTSLTFFSIDILLRLFCCSSIRKYFTSFINITDTIALVSAYVYMLCLYQVKVQRYQKSWIDFLWYVQLLRAFRLFRIMGHLRAGKVLQFVVLNNIRDFLIVAIFLVAGMCTFASVIYLAEGKDVVKDIPTGWYWAVVTMTTVGYGDIVPLTAVGRAISCVCALCGILMLAMTIPIVTENFIKLYRHASAKPASKDHVKKFKALKPKSVSLSISTDIDSRF